MKFRIVTCLVLLFIFSCKEEIKVEVATPSVASNTYTNPIFSGDYPDPSILRDGDDFYMVHSSFEYYPGLLIWHSTDLINWEPVTHALTEYLGSVWAPDLVKYENKYFIYFPASNTNYVITADNIAGPWSAPIELKVSMIDPGHITDDEGNRYLYFSSGSYVPLSKDGLSVAGDVKHVYDGWEIPREWSIECFCMEGPKLFKRGDYYYLTVAEGGTAGPATGHMVISARSKSPLGPWENSPQNPILRTTSKNEKWWSVGHGTVFNDSQDNWYMVFHGYENEFYNKGRQTMLVPITWTEDGWYKIPDEIDLESPIKVPPLKNNIEKSFDLNDDFSGETLKSQWTFYKGFSYNRFHLIDESLIVKAMGDNVANTSPLLTIPLDHSYIVDVEMELSNEAVGGLILFYNERAFSGILADSNNILANLRGWQFVTESNVINNHVFLRLKNTSNTVDMFYSLDGKIWNKIENSLEAGSYNHNVLSGFLSLRIGLVSMGDGEVKFKNFKYQSITHEE
ncbi:family 43 glycosylhydrolase [Aestuariibaculum sp. M13]|uniref:family 43 glycosylhydrolase n=1 Tax=Aestuariibaculum sp. M13 TaxID=2967132 RepID=UPI002159E52C|nr:family 43 glycosylhydrolase [Aestuariibaculum sp. M13]MCR8668001.1 family 43 glycosylhydrolase [Aestuariibaculum sp. M13]